MGRHVVWNVFLACQILCMQSLPAAIAASMQGSPLAETNSTAGPIPPSTLTALIEKSSNILCFPPPMVEGKRKLHNLRPALDVFSVFESTIKLKL